MLHDRMTTSVERRFRKLPDGLFREIQLVFTHILDENGNIKRSKLDKEITGRLYKIAMPEERSSYDEVEYQFPENEKPVRLIALGLDYSDTRYGRV